jgi:exportin-5
MVAYLSDHIEQKPASVEIDLSAFFEFMVSILNHPSLVVSIPILHSWTKLLASTHGRISATRSVIGPLLESASHRIFRYEQLPEDSNEPAIIFVSEDIEAIPERHAFLGNYRRYCFLIVESICYLEPQDAIPFVLSTTEKGLDELETHLFNLATYTKTSLTLLQADARLTVVDAALKGYSTWVAKQGKSPQKDEQTRNLLEASLENWAVTMLATRNGDRHKSSPDAANSFASGLRPAFDDPMFRQRVMKTAVEFSNRALEKKESFALKVLEYLLETQLPELPEHAVYSEAVKDLHMYATGELRRLATRHADYFSTFYDQLQAKIREISASRDLGEKAQAELPATLLIIMQRAKNIDPSLRRQRLVSFVDPVSEAWKSPQLSQNLSTIENFARFMAFDKVVQYLRSRNANQIPDWAATALDATGVAIRDEGTERYSQLPLRLTKTLLAVSVDKSVKGTQPYQIACALWSPVIPVVLPNLLRLVSYAHKLHDPRNWPDLPIEMQSIISRVLQDRFWQAGISGGTMNEFYATIAITKVSLEGFASATRGKIRNIREACYNIIYSMSRLGEVFYGYEGLSGPLAEALFASASFLSPHNFSILLDMAKRLIDDCPPSQYRLFLIPVLSTLFRQMDQKCSEEWAALDRRKAVSTNGEDLTDEMRAESILRQLCYKSVMLVASLLDPLRDQRAVEQQPLHNSDDLAAINAPKSSLRDFLLSELTILEPLLLFCAHAITYRDTRANTVVTRTLRSVVPHFATPEGRDDATSTAIREFIASDVLKAAITSLHDGYFADVQKDTAGLIATIWVAYGLPTHVAATTSEDGLHIQPAHDRPPLTESVRNLLLRLPGMTEQRVDAVGVKLGTTGGVTGSNRQQRALILVLMEGLRGVRMSELGKFDRDEAKEKSKMQEKYMQRESMGMAGLEEGGQRVDIDGEGLEELGAVAGLFS